MKRVTIVGGLATQFLPGRGELWGLNAIRPSWIQDHLWTRMFNLHRYEHMVRDWKLGLSLELAWTWLNPKVPFYVLDDPWPAGTVPNKRVFPRERLKRFFGHEYHAGSFDWLVAYAIYLRFKEIRIHGIQLNFASGEPISARACLEYWCGQAEGRGIRIVTRECDLFSQYHLVKSQTVYGYDDVRLMEQR